LGWYSNIILKRINFPLQKANDMRKQKIPPHPKKQILVETYAWKRAELIHNSIQASSWTALKSLLSKSQSRLVPELSIQMSPADI